MKHSEQPAVRRMAAIGGLMLLTGGVLAVPVIAQSVPVEEFRTSVPELGGYTAEALSSPISIQLFEPVIPVPAGPGEPHGEMHGSYSRATLGTGPSSRGLGSAIWPGAVAGDGLSAFDPRIPTYPFKADAKYPDGPYEAIGESGDPQSDRGSSDIDTGMFAYARGIDVYGESNGGGELIQDLFAAGNVKTVSTTTVVEGIVIAETVATMSDVSIAGGIVTMDGAQTRLVAQSNGEAAETDGTYEISGLEIMGRGFELTDEGIVATEPEGDPLIIPIGVGGNGIDLSDAIGVTVEPAPIVEEIDGASGSRSTRGVLITIDTTPLRQAVGFLPLAEVISMIPDVPEASVVPCGELPPEMSAIPCFSNPITALKANLFTLASLQPEIRFLIGGAQVSTSASLPFNFTPPPLPDLPPPPPVSTGGGFTPAPSFVSPPAPTTSAPQPAPVVAPPATTAGPGQQFVALQVPEGISRGLGLGAGLLSLGGIALLGRAGRKLTMAAIYGGAETASVGAAAVPDLRAFARGDKL